MRRGPHYSLGHLVVVLSVCLHGAPSITQLGLPDMVHLKSLFSPSALSTWILSAFTERLIDCHFGWDPRAWAQVDRICPKPLEVQRCMTRKMHTLCAVVVTVSSGCLVYGAPRTFMFGCCNSEMPVSWNESWALVELVLWSILSIGPVGNSSCFSSGRQTAPSLWKKRQILFPKLVEMFITLS